MFIENFFTFYEIWNKLNSKIGNNLLKTYKQSEASNEEISHKEEIKKNKKESSKNTETNDSIPKKPKTLESPDPMKIINEGFHIDFIYRRSMYKIIMKKLHPDRCIQNNISPDMSHELSLQVTDCYRKAKNIHLLFYYLSYVEIQNYPCWVEKIVLDAILYLQKTIKVMEESPHNLTSK